jgi:hypothetical protein
MSAEHQQLCIYCGVAPATTSDHVPPKCLFAEPRPDNLYTVPCCATCNAGFSLDDEYFRTAMAFRWDVSDHPAAAVVLQKALRSTGRSAGLRKLFTDTLEKAPIITHSGIYLEDGARFEADMSRIDRVLERIVRGLYYKKVGNALPSGHRIMLIADEMMQQADGQLRNEILRAWGPHLQGEPQVFGKEAFLFFWFIDPTVNCSGWFLVFFSRVIYLAITAPSDYRPK